MAQWPRKTLSSLPGGRAGAQEWRRGSLGPALFGIIAGTKDTMGWRIRKCRGHSPLLEFWASGFYLINIQNSDSFFTLFSIQGSRLWLRPWARGVCGGVWGGECAAAWRFAEPRSEAPQTLVLKSRAFLLEFSIAALGLQGHLSPFFETGIIC